MMKGGGALTPLRFAAANSYMPLSPGVTTSGAVTTYRLRYPIYIGSTDFSQLVLSFNGWYVGGSGAQNLGNAYNIVKVALEKDGAASSVPVLFSGGRTKTVNDGDSDIQSDPILPSSFSLSKFTKGEVYWVRAEYSVTSGNKLPQGAVYFTGYGGTAQDYPATMGAKFDPAVSTISPVDSFGNMIQISGVSWDFNDIAYTPVVLGRAVSGDARSFLIAGDSIVANRNSGLSRAMFDTDFVSNPIACCNFGLSGSDASLWSAGTPAKIRSYLKYGKYLIDEYGSNNFISGNGQLSVAQTDSTTLWTVGKAAGATTVLRPKLIPRTVGNITTPLNVAWASGGDARLFNNWLDTQTANVTLLARNALRAGTNQTLDTFYQWGSAANTSDFTHPNAAGELVDAADWRSVLTPFT